MRANADDMSGRPCAPVGRVAQGDSPLAVDMPLHAKREDRYSTLNWITFAAMAAFHVGAVAALFYFSWTAVLLTALFYWMCIGLGRGMGYHRLHTHRSYKVRKALED